jgi:hypothetical protein
MRTLHITSRRSVAFLTKWTTLTKMHYCYEHDVWCRSDQIWDAHLQRKHLEPLNDYCVVAAHCMFCLGADASLAVRFAQFSDVFQLHKHMKEHLTGGHATTIRPHPLCIDELSSESDFWDHATTIHGNPPFGPRRVTVKRK